MKTKNTAQSALARRSLDEGGFYNLRSLTGLILVAALAFLAFFAAANPPTRVGAGTCWRGNTPIIHEGYATRHNPEYAPW